jgi:hypothetical protein
MLECLWIQRSKAFIQDEDRSPLQQRAGDVESTALAMSPARAVIRGLGLLFEDALRLRRAIVKPS